jgi:hypothetical protein
MNACVVNSGSKRAFESENLTTVWGEDRSKGPLAVTFVLLK